MRRSQTGLQAEATMPQSIGSHFSFGYTVRVYFCLLSHSSEPLFR